MASKALLAGVTGQGTGDAEHMIGIRELLAIFLRRRWWIICAIAIGAALGAFTAFMSTPVYQAEVLLQPIKRTYSSDAMDGLSERVGGLASLAGISLGDSKDTAVAIATLKSRMLTSSFIQDRGLLPALYPNRWDSKRKRWKASDAKDVPTIWEAERYFSRKIRQINENRATGLVSMTIKWSNPSAAAEWAQDLVARTNNYLRDEAKSRARSNLEFLEMQLQQTTIVEVRQSLNKLLEEQWKQLMLAQSNEEYAFKTIDPAVVPMRKSNLPSALLILISAALFGMLSALVVVAESVVRGDQEGAPPQQF